MKPATNTASQKMVMIGRATARDVLTMIAPSLNLNSKVSAMLSLFCLSTIHAVM